MNAFHIPEAGLTRGHRPFLWSAAAAAVVVALTFVLSPLLPRPFALLGPFGPTGPFGPFGPTGPFWPFGQLPPLHAKCLGAFYLALAGMLAAAARAPDVAAVRVPLLGVAVAAAGLALAWVYVGTALAWPVAHATVAVLALVLLRSDTTLQAPAEHAHRILATGAALASSLALLLALWSEPTVRWWPWPLPAHLARLYAALFATVAVLAAALARERRREARRIGLWTLAGLAAALLAASVWHWPLFVPHAVATWAWAAGWLVVVQVATARLRR